METVTTKTDQHSVDRYADRMRGVAFMWTDVRLLALKYIEVYASNAPAERGTRAGDMRVIRNIIAAAEIVHDEMQAAGR